MITLYGMFSPNVFKVALLLEEIGLLYWTDHVPVVTGAGRTIEFLALNPLGKVPVIVDERPSSGPLVLFESGAILIYLAENYAPDWLPTSPDDPRRWEILKWLTVQVSLAAPMLGQLNHFQALPSEASSYAHARYRDQARAVYAGIDRQLEQNDWLAGSSPSIADVAMYPWAAYVRRHGFAESDFPHLTAWRSRIDRRDSTRRALKTMERLAALDAESRATPEDVDCLFNRSAAGPMPDNEAYYALEPMTSAQSRG